MIKIIAKAKGEAEILIHEEIGADWYGDGLTSRRFVSDLAKLGEDVKVLRVRINSPGGSVTDGVGIYNALRSHGARIDVVVEGLAASIASVIAMAGDNIAMLAGSLMMIHSPWTFAMGSAEDMRETADVLDKFEDALIDIYAKRTGKSHDDLKALLAAETWMNGEEAVDAGFADQADPTAEEDGAAAASTQRAVFAKFSTTFRRPADVNPSRIAAAILPSAKAEPNRSSQMNEEEKRAAEAAAKAQAEAAVQAAFAAESDRQQQIRAVFAPFADAHRALLEICVNDRAMTPAQASSKLLAAVAEKQVGPLAGTHVAAGVDAREKFRAGAEQAILVRMGRATREASNEFNGMSLADLARRSLAMAGHSVHGLTNDGVARKVLSFHTTSDFPQLLSSTAGKVLRVAYEAFTPTWKSWAAVGQVSDFKIHPRIQMGSFTDLAALPEGGEYSYGSLTEAYENAQAATKGKAIAFTRQMLVNDDLGGFNRRATLMGDAAARTVNSDAYAFLTSGAGNNGPTSTDTVQFFHATHGNLTGTGTALSVASLGVGRVAMQKQKDSSGKQTLNIKPSILLVPVAKEDTARALMTSETDPASSNSKVPNIYKGRFEVVADPYLDGISATAWYLLAASGGAAAPFEVVFLDGNEVPFVDDEVDFDTDALKFKVRLDYGVAIGDWRGGYKNAGA